LEEILVEIDPPIFLSFFTTTDLLTQRVYRFGKGALGHNQARWNILLLTTIGRKGGTTRTRALLYLKVVENWIKITSHGGNPKHPDWYLNLLNQPKSRIQIGRSTHDIEAG